MFMKKLKKKEIDFVELKGEITKELEGNGINPLGPDNRNLEGVPLSGIKLGHNICTQLHWLNSNSEYTFRVVLDLGASDGTLAVNAYDSDGKLSKNITDDITGGDNGDPVAQVVGDLLKMVNKLALYVDSKN